MIKKIIYLLVFLLQFSGIILAIVLENLSSERMGVARYLVFKKQVFESTLFTSFHVNIYLFMLVAGTIVCVTLLLKKRTGGTVLFTTLTNIIGILFLQFKIDLQAYYFFVIGIFIVLTVQYVWMIYFYLSNNSQKKSVEK